MEEMDSVRIIQILAARYTIIFKEDKTNILIVYRVFKAYIYF